MSLLSVIRRAAGGLGLSTTVELPVELPDDNIMEDLVISAGVQSTAASARTIVLANEETCKPDGSVFALTW